MNPTTAHMALTKTCSMDKKSHLESARVVVPVVCCLEHAAAQCVVLLASWVVLSVLWAVLLVVASSFRKPRRQIKPSHDYQLLFNVILPIHAFAGGSLNILHESLDNK